MTVVPSTTQREQSPSLGGPLPQSADPIDRVVRLAPTWTVFVLLACGLLVAGTIVWAMFGTVTSSVSTRGLYVENGATNVVATEPGRVSRVLVSLSQEVKQGQDVVALAGGSALTSPLDGTVTAILVSDGSSMSAGMTAIVVTDLSVPDQVVTQVPLDQIGTVVVGMPVRMEVPIAPSSKYGYLLGTVDELSHVPYTLEQTAARLGLEQEVVAAELGSQPALLATIRLDVDESTPSRYRWSVGDGPPFSITQGAPVHARIILDEEHPLEVVFPGLGRQGS